MRFNPDFIILPFEVLQDDRLTLRQIRVLMAILSWRKKNTNVSAISREMISDRTGYPISRVSTITAELENLGWIKKEGNGGRSKWIRYQICDVNLAQDSAQNGYQNGNDLSSNKTVPETVTVTKTETVTDSDLNGYQNGIETVTNSVTRIDTDKEQIEIQRDTPLIPQGGNSPDGDASLENLNQRDKRKPAITMKTFIENCKQTGESLITDYKPVFDYADGIGLPRDMLNLAWLEFRRRYTEVDGSKRYKDWRKAFLNCVTGNWYRLWWLGEDGYVLTTQGKQAQELHAEVV